MDVLVSRQVSCSQVVVASSLPGPGASDTNRKKLSAYSCGANGPMKAMPAILKKVISKGGAL
jgi:hypothetical protein